jgi:hypothetical protein
VREVRGCHGSSIHHREAGPCLSMLCRYANKHIVKAASFMAKYSDLGLFPVKLQVPIVLSVHLLLAFR